MCDRTGACVGISASWWVGRYECFLRDHIPIGASISVCVYVCDVRMILLCERMHSKQSLPHRQETISSLPRLLWCFLLSSGFSLAAAEKLFQHSGLRKEQASLAWVEMPFSAILYLSIAPAPSPDEIRKVGQWRAKEGCSTGMLEAGREADEGVEERWEGGGLCTEDISPCLKPGWRHSLSWFDFLLCCSTYSAHCNGCWVWTWMWQRQVKGISHLKKERCLFSSAGLLAYLSKWTSKATGK